MKLRACLSLFAISFLSIGGVPLLVIGQDVDPVARVQGEFDGAIKADEEPIVEFEKLYVDKLKALQQTFELKGDLERALKVKAEIEGFSNDIEREYRDVPDLFRLRKIYDDNAKRLRAEASTRQIKTRKKFAKTFEELKVELTKNGNLEAAVKAEKLRQSILKQLETEKNETGVANTTTDPVTEKARILWALKGERDFTVMRECKVTESDGKWVLAGVPGRPNSNDFSFINSDKQFSPPFRISSRVATDSIEIRYDLKNRHFVILSWLNDPTSLHIHNPVTSLPNVRLPGKGALEKNRFYQIDIDVTSDSVRVFVDGDLRGKIEGDFKDLHSHVGIGQALGSEITVEKFEIHSLDDG